MFTCASGAGLCLSSMTTLEMQRRTSRPVEPAWRPRNVTSHCSLLHWGGLQLPSAKQGISLARAFTFRYSHFFCVLHPLNLLKSSILSRLQERKRIMVRLEKLRNGLVLIDKQLDALRSSELDKELMNSLRVSSQAMKKAGIGVGVDEAEKVMNELDDQIREASEVTTVLSTPIATPLVCDPVGLGEDDIADIDAELGLIFDEDPFAPVSTTQLVPPVSASTILEHNRPPAAAAVHALVAASAISDHPSASMDSASGGRALLQQPASGARAQSQSEQIATRRTSELVSIPEEYGHGRQQQPELADF